jgi:stage IV sporulation protein FB
MFGHMQSTPYDLQFSVAGVPVRVHPVFWLTAAFISWQPGRLDLVFVRVLCVFVSILVHELGHALVTRLYGWRPEIVLEFFGGYATTTHHDTWKNIAVTAAGPAAGFLLFFAVLTIAVTACDLSMLKEGWAWAIPLVGHLVLYGFVLTGGGAGLITQEVLIDAIHFLLFINFAWNFLNLIPVLPLDGGQIAREYITWLRPRDGQETAYLVSTIAGAGFAAWIAYRHSQNQGAFGLHPVFLMLMFGYLAFQSFQAYQASRRGYW